MPEYQNLLCRNDHAVLPNNRRDKLQVRQMAVVAPAISLPMLILGGESPPDCLKSDKALNIMSSAPNLFAGLGGLIGWIGQRSILSADCPWDELRRRSFMKRNRKGGKRRKRTVQLWRYETAQAAVPYLSAVVRSLRDHWLEAAARHQRARRLAARPGRPDRATLIAHEEALKDAAEAENRFADTLAELEAVDVFCLEPSRGQALVPFIHEDELAWYVYDLFESKPFRFWRFHSDPLDTRRPIAEALNVSPKKSRPA
jgi:hypothetical protein